ncbi:MAG: hypothetical protein JSS02_27735 [Planctomycetes bacterium]|nr:hypothetical protein [Planctomycetota bacterium]
MRKVLSTLMFLVTAAPIFPGFCAAGTITYDVNQTIGGGSVVGTVETDGTTSGALNASNITAWNLTLTGLQGSTFTLTNSNSGVFVSGSDVTATPTNLFFNFSGTDDGYLLFQASFGSGTHYWGLATSTTGLLLQGQTVVPGTVFDSPQTYQYEAESGNQIIGTVHTNGAVPEPSSFAPFIIVGISLVMGAYRRQRAARSVTS